MVYKARDYRELIGMNGFSETLLKTHFALYEGYVNHTNKIMDILSKKPKEGSNPEYAELKRRFAFEFDGMRMHELYFENLGGMAPVDRDSKFAEEINDCFGSWQNWEEDFKATGKMRGVGWAVLYLDSVSGEFFNVWINEHMDNHLAGCRPLLIMDVWEHAFMLDYGLKRGDYMEAFLKNVNWVTVSNRFEMGVKAAMMSR